MKAVVYLSLIFWMIGVFGCTPKGYKIEGSVADAGRTTISLVAVGEDGKMKTLQSVASEDGVFVFEGEVKEPRLCFLVLPNKFGRIPLMLENAGYKITIGAKDENNATNYVVETDGALQKVRNEYQVKQRELLHKSDSLTALYDNAKKITDLVETAIIY